MLQVSFDSKGQWEQEEAVRLPGSKSMAARLLILDYIRAKETERAVLPMCDDTQYLAEAMAELRRLPAGGRFYLGSGATSLRFFVALVASVKGFDGEVDASPQLRRRPLAPLVDALRSVGADIEYLGKEGYPPLYIKGKRLRGGKLEVNGTLSSQFISAILLASQLWEKPAEIQIRGEQVSTPYIDLTRRMIERCDEGRLEADWSAATFFYEI
ncbi:MAG: hypothetical protein K2K97_08100, partial [Muribaculaceae bacterium]|nr:hypothetical protein [Muribaculaceae bacterium]